MKSPPASCKAGKTPPPAHATATSWYTSYWIVAAAVLALACEAFSAALRGPFVFDDFALPYTSPLSSNMSLVQWLSGVRPVLMWTYWMNYQPSPSSTIGYHLTNVAIHALNSLLLFAVSRRLFGLYFADVKRVFIVSAFSCSLFLLHPLQTESVAYIAARSEVLSATFVLAAWLIYVRRIGTPITTAQVCAILLLWVLAGASKEQAVATLPAIFLLTDWTVQRDGIWAEIRANKRLYAPMALGGILGVVWVSTILLSSQTAGPNAGVSSYEYLLTQFRAVLLYLRLFFVPLGQNADRWLPISHNWFEHGALLALCIVAAGIFVLLRREALVRYGGLLFLAFLAPTSSIIPLADAFAERRMYLPIAALAIAIGAAIANARLRNHRVAMIAVGISAVAFVLTTQRAGVWSSSLTFWQDVVTKSPGNVRAYRNLTQSYVASGRCEDAIKHLERETASVPRDYFVLVNWAQAYRCAQRPEAALKKLEEADRLRTSAFVSGIRGELLLKMGRTDEAREAFAQAVALEKPGTDLAYVYEGNLALLRNNYVEAAEAYRRAIAVNPASPEAMSLLRRLEPIVGRNERAGNPWQPQSP